MNYSSLVVRGFLIEHFSDEEIEGLCFDYFPEVQNVFSAGMSKTAKIHRLIEYCQLHGLLPRLTEAIQAQRPDQFTSYVSSIALDMSSTKGDSSEVLLREGIRLELVGDIGRALELYRRVKQMDPFCSGIDTRIRAAELEMGEKYVDRQGAIDLRRLVRLSSRLGLVITISGAGLLLYAFAFSIYQDRYLSRFRISPGTATSIYFLIHSITAAITAAIPGGMLFAAGIFMFLFERMLSRNKALGVRLVGLAGFVLSCFGAFMFYEYLVWGLPNLLQYLAYRPDYVPIYFWPALVAAIFAVGFGLVGSLRLLLTLAQKGRSLLIVSTCLAFAQPIVFVSFYRFLMDYYVGRYYIVAGLIVNVLFLYCLYRPSVKAFWDEPTSLDASSQ